MCNYSTLSTITRFVNSNVTSDELLFSLFISLSTQLTLLSSLYPHLPQGRTHDNTFPEIPEAPLSPHAAFNLQRTANIIIKSINFRSLCFKLQISMIIKLQCENSANLFCKKNTHDLQFLLHMIWQRIKVFIKVIFLFIGACAAKHYILLIQLSPTFLFSSVSTTFSQVICPIHCRIIAISGEYHLRKCA